MKLLTLSVLMVALVGCGRGAVVPEAHDPAFNEYLSAWDKDAAHYGYAPAYGNISIQFGDVPTMELAVCHLSTLTQAAYIVVDRKYWGGLMHSAREAVIYHELGHCLLHQGHRSTRSVMFPVVFDNTSFEDSRDYFVKELFTFGAPN